VAYHQVSGDGDEEYIVFHSCVAADGDELCSSP
jgi:hypothetical protein